MLARHEYYCPKGPGLGLEEAPLSQLQRKACSSSSEPEITVGEAYVRIEAEVPIPVLMSEAEDLCKKLKESKSIWLGCRDVGAHPACAHFVLGMHHLVVPSWWFCFPSVDPRGDGALTFCMKMLNETMDLYLFLCHLPETYAFFAVRC